MVRLFVVCLPTPVSSASTVNDLVVRDDGLTCVTQPEQYTKGL